jgi:ABC-type thiamin/hydroxymethylpyrimidine transport system permease subunit
MQYLIRLLLVLHWTSVAWGLLIMAGVISIVFVPNPDIVEITELTAIALGPYFGATALRFIIEGKLSFFPWSNPSSPI